MGQLVVAKRRAPYSRGSTAIEFALVAPLLIFMLGAIVETSAFLLVQYQMQGITQKVVRKQLQVSNLPADASAFKSELCAQIAILSNCVRNLHVDVQRATNFGSLPARRITDVGPPQYGGSYVDSYNPARPGEAGSVIVTYDWRFAFRSWATPICCLRIGRWGLGLAMSRARPTSAGSLAMSSI